MSSFISRLLKSSLPTKRLVSQLTQRGEDKLTALLRQLGLKKVFGSIGTKAVVGHRGISTTPVANKRKWVLFIYNASPNASLLMFLELTDDMELATGIFKRELQLRTAGCTDPWAMAKPMKRGAGTEDEPTEVPSVFDARMVGCLCLDDRIPKWMWLEKGSPKRCECGHYYVLKKDHPI
ncbi:hypothetical protein KR093_008137 [Drosophila rubida]|uniref:Cytochrome c oxidase subunit 5B, mitochondrial n=1 Tax=Drosophila rubida TaxID=30044 RepID=A0AAD4K5N0_9MUSC|nr:hypothetical protein KR093_008137 [Drosophila rubida]